jgi:hypothetical protein
MSKKRRPGQIANVSGKVLRCAKREFGCEGCVLNDILLCPNRVKNGETEDCIENKIIFIPVVK